MSGLLWICLKAQARAAPPARFSAPRDSLSPKESKTWRGCATSLRIFSPDKQRNYLQLHKGGPREELFLQLIDEPRLDLEIPETDYSFGTLIQAQSLCDFQALKKRGGRVLRVNLKADIKAGLEQMQSLVQS